MCSSTVVEPLKRTDPHPANPALPVWGSRVKGAPWAHRLEPRFGLMVMGPVGIGVGAPSVT